MTTISEAPVGRKNLWTHAGGLLLFFIGVSPWTVSAAELAVPADYGTIQGAIDAAVAGDSVVVAPGTYYERIVMKQEVDVVAQGTTEEREAYITAAATLINVSSLSGNPVVAVQGADLATLDGFTIIGAGNGGTGVLTVEPQTMIFSSPTVQNCIITGSTIGIAAGSGAAPSILHNKIYGNEVGIGTSGPDTMPMISGNQVYSNTQVGIGCDESAPTIDGNLVYDNAGPGIAARNGATPLIINNIVGLDSAGQPAGNLLAGIGSNGGSPTIRYNGVFYSGKAGIGARGGASPIITDNEVAYNTEAGIGSQQDDPAYSLEVHRNWVHENGAVGIGANGVIGTISNNIVEHNVTAGIAVYDVAVDGIYNNVVAYNGEVGITNQTATPFPIENNICMNNVKPGIKADAGGYDYNLLFGNNGTTGQTGSMPYVVYPNYGGNWSGDHGVYPIQDPMFVDPEASNYHLQAGSPAIDAGNPDAAFNDTDASINDLGAYGGPEPMGDGLARVIHARHRLALIQGRRQR